MHTISITRRVTNQIKYLLCTSLTNSENLQIKRRFLGCSRFYSCSEKKITFALLYNTSFSHLKYSKQQTSQVLSTKLEMGAIVKSLLNITTRVTSQNKPLSFRM